MDEVDVLSLGSDSESDEQGDKDILDSWLGSSEPQQSLGFEKLQHEEGHLNDFSTGECAYKQRDQQNAQSV